MKTNRHLEKSEKMRNYLLKLYTDVDSKSSSVFTSVEPLYREARLNLPDISRKDVREFLATLPVYTRHRRVVRRFRRLPTIAPGLHTDWQCDLSDMQRLGRENKGFGYFLLCIDSLSRQIFVEPIKKKTAICVIQGFETIFHRCGYHPWKLVSDSGLEFTGKTVQEYLNNLGIKHFSMYTSPKFHAGMAERANRSVKERLYRYFTHNNTRRWIDVIQSLVESINSSPCSSIGGLRPIDVTFENSAQVRDALKQKIFEKYKTSKNRVYFKVGDFVRIESYKHVFQKGYLPNFTNEIFMISHVRRHTMPVTYRVTDSNGDVLRGWFYAQDLSRVIIPPENTKKKRLRNNNILVDEEPTWTIDRIVDRKHEKGGIEYCLVKWKGFETDYNSWIPASSIIVKNNK